jgi:hypothetical protein
MRSRIVGDPDPNFYVGFGPFLSDPDIFTESGSDPVKTLSTKQEKLFFTSTFSVRGISYSPRSDPDPDPGSEFSQWSDPDTSNGSDPQTLRSRIKIIRLRNTEIYCMMNFVQWHLVKNVAMSDSGLSDTGIGINFSSVGLIRYRTRGL